MEQDNLSPVARRIATYWAPEFLRLFLEKNADYTGKDMPVDLHMVLGLRGQFSDIYRKVWKLKKPLWDGESLVGEQPDEILLDLIGHCFLALDLLERAANAEAEGQGKHSESCYCCGGSFNPDAAPWSPDNADS